MSRVGSLLGAYVTLSIASQVAKKTKLLKGGKMKVRVKPYYRKIKGRKTKVRVRGHMMRSKKKRK